MSQTTQRRERFNAMLDGHEIYDEQTREAYERDALERYAAKFYEGGAESGYSDNPDVVTRETIEELAKYATHSISDDPAWAPVDMIDLDTGRELTWDVVVRIDAPGTD
jgi:hypothetical protein